MEEGSPLGPALGCSCLSGLGGGSLTPGRLALGSVPSSTLRLAHCLRWPRPVTDVTRSGKPGCVWALLRPPGCHLLVRSLHLTVLSDRRGPILALAVLARRMRAYSPVPLWSLGRAIAFIPMLLEGGRRVSPAPPFLVVWSPDPPPAPLLGVVTPLPFPVPGHGAKNLAMGEVPSSLLAPGLLPLGSGAEGLRRAGPGEQPACKTSGTLPCLSSQRRAVAWAKPCRN